MIKDFLDHLLWELRINHMENTNPGMKPNPELSEQLAKHMKKYHTIGLMEAIRINPCGMPEDEANETIESFHVALAQRSLEAIEALETLQPTLETAFECASQPDAFIVREINMDDVARFIRDEDYDDETQDEDS
jgi:hypothetical protein